MANDWAGVWQVGNADLSKRLDRYRGQRLVLITMPVEMQNGRR